MAGVDREGPDVSMQRGGPVAAPGRLLVANPLLPDPNFDRTVVLLLAAGDDGALGLVLNRPSQTRVGTPLPRWEPLATDPAVLFLGGPVQHQAMICLAGPGGSAAAATGTPGDPGIPGEPAEPAGPGEPDWKALIPGVGTLDLDVDPARLGDRFERIRLFAGYAGWGAGQLEAEIAAGAWWVVEADPSDPFSADPDGLWVRVLRRQRLPLAFVSWFPDDPAAN